MMVSTLVGTKGQVTIEKAIREALGVRPGWRAVQRREGDRVVIEFLPPKHRRSLAGILSEKTTVRIPTDEEFRAAVERAWEEEVREDWEAQSAPTEPPVTSGSSAQVATSEKGDAPELALPTCSAMRQLRLK